jgi:hypothetical protein
MLALMNRDKRTVWPDSPIETSENGPHRGPRRRSVYSSRETREERTWHQLREMVLREGVAWLEALDGVT